MCAQNTGIKSNQLKLPDVDIEDLREAAFILADARWALFFELFPVFHTTLVILMDLTKGSRQAFIYKDDYFFVSFAVIAPDLFQLQMFIGLTYDRMVQICMSDAACGQ